MNGLVILHTKVFQCISKERLIYSLVSECKPIRTWDILAILNVSSFNSVGVFKNGRVEIIANDQGNRITPSYVAFTAEGERLIGDAAKNQLTTNPENTVFDAKRMIGREWTDKAVQSDIKYFPFKVSSVYVHTPDEMIECNRVPE